MEMNMNLIKMGNQVVGDMSLDEMGVLSQQINDMRMKRIIEQLQSQDRDIKLMKQEDKKKSAQIQEINKNYEILNEIIHTYTLIQDDEKLLELKNAIQSRIFHLTSGDRTDCRYILFYSRFSAKCRNDLKRHFGVTKYDKIKISDFKYAKDFVNSWRPNSLTDKIIKECQKKEGKINPKTKEPMLSNTQEIALNEYLNRTKGGTERFI